MQGEHPTLSNSILWSVTKLEFRCWSHYKEKLLGSNVWRSYIKRMKTFLNS